nr:Clp protease regulatory subunit CLPX3 mitochondrial [Tanacetum cinerariifolium]
MRMIAFWIKVRILIIERRSLIKILEEQLAGRVREDVESILYKLLTIVNVPEKGARKYHRGDNIQIDTKDFLFICGGAFSFSVHVSRTCYLGENHFIKTARLFYSKYLVYIDKMVETSNRFQS